MTISRIADLFAANLDSVQRTNAKKSAYGSSAQAPVAPRGDSDAVKVSTSSVNRPPEQSTQQSERFAAIKAQVESGTYRPDSEKVSRALIVDLF